MKTSLRILVVVLVLAPLGARAEPGGIFGRAASGCGGNGCHASSATPTTRVCISGLPADGTYSPSTLYALTVFVDGLGVPPSQGLATSSDAVAGFNLAVSAGALSKDPADDSLWGDPIQDPTQLTHTYPGNKRNHWSFSWTAPASGLATLSAAGNAVNGNGGADTGDLWSKTSVTLTSGAGGGIGTGIFCNPPLPLPQLVPVPAHP